MGFCKNFESKQMNYKFLSSPLSNRTSVSVTQNCLSNVPNNQSQDPLHQPSIISQNNDSLKASLPGRSVIQLKCNEFNLFSLDLLSDIV